MFHRHSAVTIHAIQCVIGQIFRCATCDHWTLKLAQMKKKGGGGVQREGRVPFYGWDQHACAGTIVTISLCVSARFSPQTFRPLPFIRLISLREMGFYLIEVTQCIMGSRSFGPLFSMRRDLRARQQQNRWWNMLIWNGTCRSFCS